jgi:5'-AMP-activated protein kinase catalytic alpha subunit
MELCPQGSLRTRIVQQSKLTEPQCKLIFRQLIEAVAYLHSRKLAHRDLKPENILIDDSDRIKLIDFGLSNYTGEDGLCATRVGSTCYAAPECFSPGRYDAFKSDIWSCGVVLFTILTGQIPWSGHNDQIMIDQISKCEYFIPVAVSPDANDLIQKILTLDLQKRFSAEQILRHPFLTNVPLIHARMPDVMPERSKVIKGSSSQPMVQRRARALSETAVRLIQEGKFHRMSKNAQTARRGDSFDV